MLKTLCFSFMLFLVISIGPSCTKSFQPGTASIPKASSGWWVNYYVGGVALLPKPVFYSTYNTSANQNDSMWIDDLGQFWDFKGKVALNYQALTFSSPLSVNVYYADTAKIANGKILHLGGHSRLGFATDSIYMELQFSDDSSPYGTTYVLQGTARTGFVGDDY